MLKIKLEKASNLPDLLICVQRDAHFQGIFCIYYIAFSTCMVLEKKKKKEEKEENPAFEKGKKK